MNARLIAKPDEEWAKIMDEIDYKIFRFRRSNGLTTVTADGFFVRIFSRICLLWLQLQRLRC